MGCNGSKSVAAVMSTDATDADPNGVPSAVETETATATAHSQSDVEPIAKDNSDTNTTNGGSATRPVTPAPVPPSMAFDIPFNDEPDVSIVKKHPPKRLQRLEEQQQNASPVLLEDLQEKQQEAETRRQQFLQMRAQSAKRKYALRNNNNELEDKQSAEDDGQCNVVDIEVEEVIPVA